MTKDNLSLRNTQNNYASKGFIDLFLSEESISNSRKVLPELLDYRVFYFQQGIEKFLKACLTQKNIQVKDYGHNFSKLIKGIIEYYPEQSRDFLKGLAWIGNQF